MKTNVHFWSYLAHFFLEWEIFQTDVVEKIKRHVLCSVTVFFNCAIYEIMLKNILEPGKPQMTIWRMRIACWIPEATNTHSEYVIRIAFPLQPRLHARPSVLHYTFIACLVTPVSPTSLVFLMSFIAVLIRYPVTFCMTSTPGSRGHNYILTGMKLGQPAGRHRLWLFFS